jgi:hypothetical protein
LSLGTKLSEKPLRKSGTLPDSADRLTSLSLRVEFKTTRHRRPCLHCGTFSSLGRPALLER